MSGSDHINGGLLVELSPECSILQIGVFLHKGRSFHRVALIDASISADSSCYSFVLTNAAKHNLAAICGNEVCAPAFHDDCLINIQKARPEPIMNAILVSYRSWRSCPKPRGMRRLPARSCYITAALQPAECPTS